jgi:uncharacterized integral membrane protein (TIGR00697 family)
MTYVLVIVMSNWFDSRIIQLYGNIVTDAGTLIFPLTFLISDIITEVYGYKYARKSIWFGFIFNVIFILFGIVVTHSGSPAFALKNNLLFDTIFSANISIIIASFSSYWLSEPLNSFIMAKLKIITRGRYMPVRFVSSTIVSSFFDSVLFSHIAFLHTYDYSNIWLLIISMWAVKVFVEVIGLPLTITVCKNLKVYERMDRYDLNTNFSILSTDILYDDKMSNKFIK